MGIKKQKTVLIVDDSKLILKILEQEINELLDVRIIKATNFKDALKHILQEEIIHVAILDLGLPDAKDGEIVDYAIRKDIPSVVLTGTLNNQLKKTILEKDILDYIVKDSPTSIKSVVNIISRTLENYDTNVMIVEDSPMQLKLAKQQLEKMKLNVSTAINGQKALDLINKGDINYSLILTDYNMPVMDGLELTFKLREDFKKSQLGILVLSANTAPDIATDFIKAGANDFINKPYTQVEFKTRINANLELIDLFETANKQKAFTQTLLDSQAQLIITTQNLLLQNVNKTFLDFFEVSSIDAFNLIYDATCICDTFNIKAPKGYIQKEIDGVNWIDYILNTDADVVNKVLITVKNIDYIFSVDVTKLENEDGMSIVVLTDITSMEDATKEIQRAHRNIKDSINYASIIQHAILPASEIMDNYTKENFVFWQPRDTVGGDIYFVSELKSKEEILIMIIDGAGHGVPGAFVTMLVKAIETQIIADIEHDYLKPSPAKILEYFNRAIKTMLKQEKGAKSNAGFDGAILYYNKKTNECKYAGAKTPLYVVNDGNMEIIKGDRKNVGYARMKIDQEYTEFDVQIDEGTKLYIATDGIVDQEGRNDTRYEKSKLEKLLLNNSNESFEKQKLLIENDFNKFKKNIEQSDDVTIMGIQFK